MARDIDLTEVLAREFGMSRNAIDCAFRHGTVRIDGRVLENIERVLSEDEVRGKFLSVYSRVVRLVGHAEVQQQEIGPVVTGSNIAVIDDSKSQLAFNV